MADSAGPTSLSCARIPRCAAQDLRKDLAAQSFGTLIGLEMRPAKRLVVAFDWHRTCFCFRE
jgi:hypothetical protein